MQATREKILETTFLLTIEKGYDAISVSDIQKELNISRGLLYFYFKNKSELIFEACKYYFFENYLSDIDLEHTSLKDFISHICKAEKKLLYYAGKKINVLKYNAVYSMAIMREPKFQKYAGGEFSKAIKVIENAKANKEIKDLPTNFVGATIMSILGRTSYVTKTKSEEYLIDRIAEDLEIFYNLIKR